MYYAKREQSQKGTDMTKTLGFKRKSVLNPNVENNNGLVVEHYGYEQTQPNKKIVTSDEYPTFRLHFIVKGSVNYTLNGKTEKLEANTFFLLSPQSGAQHSTDSENPAFYYWVSFFGTHAKDYSEMMGFSKENGSIVIPQQYKKQILAFFNDNFKKINNEIIDIVLLKNFLSIVEVLSSINLSATKTPKSKHDSEIYAVRAMEYINECYPNPYLSRDDIAQNVNIDKTYLSTLFTEYHGMSIMAYLTQKRISKATVLLKNTDIPVQEISAKVGYLDALYFSKVFKRINKLSPTQYRKQCRQNPSNNA